MKRFLNRIKSLSPPEIGVMLTGLVAGLVALIFFVCWQVSALPGTIYTDVEALPPHRVAVVLGTSPHIAGRPNLYYLHRLEAAARLYHAGKVKKLLVSGDHGRQDYNEPDRMRDDLVARGVAREDVGTDYAGFRTLDSMARAAKVFQLEEFVVVSQGFHCERALFLARHLGVRAVGFVAQDLSWRFRLKMLGREFFARIAAWLDIRILHRSPRFLGKTETI